LRSRNAVGYHRAKPARFSSEDSVTSGSANEPLQPRRSDETEPLVYFAVGVAWAVVAYGIWRQARREDARRKVREVSSKLLAQVFPHGVAP
jgi:hypothetical protein